MKQLIKPVSKKEIDNSIVDALCSENNCSCSCDPNSNGTNGNTANNKSTIDSQDDILF